MSSEQLAADGNEQFAENAKNSGPTRDEMNEWLTANCGRGLPYGEATDTAGMLHGLAYTLRQIEGTTKYMVNIGQCTSATSALRMALDHFARQALAAPTRDGEVTPALVAGEVGASAGWQLVPVEASPAMRLSGASAWLGFEVSVVPEWGVSLDTLWSAMLAAAPQPPALAQPDAGEVERLRIIRDEALRALKIIRSYNDADDETSYRSDDREGCLDASYSEADRALRYIETVERAALADRSGEG